MSKKNRENDNKKEKEKRKSRPAMEDPALGNDAIVDLGRRIVGQGDGTSAESGEKIFNEMEFEKIVEKNREG